MFKIFSPKLIFIFILAGFNLIIGLRTQINFFYLCFWFLTAGVAISFLVVVIEYWTARLILIRRFGARVEEDDTLEIETVIRNQGPLPILNFVLEDNLSCAPLNQRRYLILIDYLGAVSSVGIKYSCICPQRDRYTIGPFVGYFFDPFGIFFFKRTYYVYSEVYVYPKTFSIKKFPPLAKGILPWFGIETSQKSEGDDEFFGVREYKEGDPIKRIHWITSARKNTLIIRQFQSQSYFRATIIFNLEKDKNFGQGKEKVAEYIIKIAASIAKYLLNQNVSVEIIAHTKEFVQIPFNKGPAHLEEILRFFTFAKAESEISLGEIFGEYRRFIADNSSLIVIMLDKDWERLPEMLPLDKRNVSFIPLVLLSSTFLYTFEKEKIVSDVRQKVSRVVNFSPIVFARGDNLEEVFLRY